MSLGDAFHLILNFVNIFSVSSVILRILIQLTVIGFENNSVPCTVRTSRQRSCNQRVGCLQWLGSRALGFLKCIVPCWYEIIDLAFYHRYRQFLGPSAVCHVWYEKPPILHGILFRVGKKSPVKSTWFIPVFTTTKNP